MASTHKIHLKSNLPAHEELTLFLNDLMDNARQYPFEPLPRDIDWQSRRQPSATARKDVLGMMELALFNAHLL